MGEEPVASSSAVCLNLGNQATATWETTQPMSESRAGAAVAVTGSFVYVIGGSGAESEALRTAERFDVNTGIWEVLSQMLVPRSFAAAHVLHERLYVCCGVGGSAKARYPRVLECLGACPSSRPRGPRGRKQARRQVQGEAWHQLPRMADGRTGAAVAAARSFLFVCGGCREEIYLSAAERFDVASSRWETLPPMRHRRADAAAVTAAGGLIVCGGEDGANVLRAVERLDLSAPLKWEVLVPLATPRAGASATAGPSGLYVFGGFEGPHLLADAEHLAPRAARWQALPPRPAGRRAGATAVTVVGPTALAPRPASPGLAMQSCA